ncbi:MAG: UvrD-helicase domain-containing protein, partial [Bacteroidales bacterium]
MAYLKVYKASAGSGKTFTLALEYLKHLIRNPYAYRRILAVTFTNKATGEMKKRILLELNNLATGNNSPYLEAITRENEWPPEEIRKRAGLSLKLLLHDFSRFYVETIDRFFHRVTRSFAREIGLQTGFNIELDTSKVLRESVDTMLFQLPGEEVVKDWLVRFAESRIEEGKSWNFKNDILNTGQEIFSEKFKLFSKTLIDKLGDKQFLNDYLKKLYKIRSFFTDTLHAYGQEALERMQQFGLEISDFAYGTKGFANYFIKLSGKKDFKPGIRTRNAVNNLSAWSTKGSEKTEQIQQAYQEGLNRILAQSVSFYDSHIEDFESAETIYGFIYTLGILTDIARHVNDYCKK